MAALFKCRIKKAVTAGQNKQHKINYYSAVTTNLSKERVLKCFKYFLPCKLSPAAGVKFHTFSENARTPASAITVASESNNFVFSARTPARPQWRLPLPELNHVFLSVSGHVLYY